MIFLLSSCATLNRAGHRKLSIERVNKKIERGIKKGMRYNHRKTDNIRPLKIKPVNYYLQ